MEIKINKEIRSYHETIFFGLTFRQFLCSCFAVGIALLIYFGLKVHTSDEVLSWLCIVCAAPVAVAGFFQYNGLNLERFLWTVIKSEFIFAGRRMYRSENIYYKLLSGGKCEHEHKKFAWIFKRNKGTGGI